VALTSHTGALVQQYRYTVWGEPQVFNAGNQSRPLSEARSPFLFTAREFDLETGLYHYRARAYSPQLGRFLQFDPIDFGGGDSGLQRYVHNRPVDKTDPHGLTAHQIGCLRQKTDCEIDCAGRAMTGGCDGDWFRRCMHVCEVQYQLCMVGKGFKNPFRPQEIRLPHEPWLVK
jgi:RHS repeat-associated protein